MSSQGNNKYSVIVIGDAEVGKTCLVKRIMSGAFDDATNNNVGIDHFDIDLEHKEKKFNVSWFDTAGQERYEAITKSFFRGSHVALVAFSLADRTTMDALTRWFDMLRDEVPQVRRIMVGTKCDLELEVDLTEAKNFAENNGADFIKTSAKNGEGISDLLELIAENIYEISQGGEDSSPIHIILDGDESRKRKCNC